MRIAIFDGILEGHVAQSLERSLLRRGHSVLNTGRIGKGFAFPQEPETLRYLNAELDRVLDFKPDVILVFRPASMPYALLRRARSSGALLMAWFSDDPVLWNLSYGLVVDFYDVILHCGNSNVLRFYEREHGRPTGVNFPFWTDNVAFPYVYRANPPANEAMFLGNVRGPVRARRYADLAGLTANVKIFGNVDDDPAGIWGGYADSNLEVMDVASRSLMGLNIPQVFSDHVGTPTWFPGLDKLSFFQYPSRVIQYAAMGLPIVSMIPDSRHLESFPEISCVRNPQELDDEIHRLVHEVDLNELSALTHTRFVRSYSADSRVLALEALVNGDVEWRGLSAEERTSLFLDYEANSYVEPLPILSGVPSNSHIKAMTVEDQLRAHLESMPVAQRTLRIAITGIGWSNETSDISTIVRGLDRLGHEVEKLNPYRRHDLFAAGRNGKTKFMLQADPYVNSGKPPLDVFVFVGDWVSIAPMDAAVLRDQGCVLLHLASSVKVADMEEQRTAALMTYTTTLDPSVPKEFHALGLPNVGHMPKLMDRSFVEALLKEPFKPEAIGILACRPGDLDAYKEVWAQFAGKETRTFISLEGNSAIDSLALLASACRVGTVLALPESSKKNSPVSPLLAYGLIGGGLTVTMRRTLPAVAGPVEQYFVSVQNGDELTAKIPRFEHGEWAEDIRRRGQTYGLEFFSAEDYLDGLLATVLN
ncbi:hypothetical protein [Arthrobacter yangruifuii]|uniref:hypothetical protein n=1 Tax=Arthrobacter yangruifuii TaxID=2606616 RepID=UPI0011B78B30|nr:hypothetical protein [Arthrobacter yangruifuii]